MTTFVPYPQVSQQPSFSAIEKNILKFWKDAQTFQKSVCQFDIQKEKKREFVFYDGPPFANGLPHYGHLLTGYVKDLIPRYRTMRGEQVERRFGWDCHGLPAEMEAEKDLKVSGRADIQKFGIQKFNEYCRTSVLKYTKEWEQYVTRQGRWVSFENDYKTMDLSYMESVIWAFKQLWEKGLVYEGYRVMPYSWACETPLSNFEIRLDNSYRSKQDPAVTVMFTLKREANDTAPLKLLVWTTTPWTLPSNLAIAVGNDIDYGIYEEDGVGYILAEATAQKYEKELKNSVKKSVIKGRELVGRKYEPLFPYFKEQKNAFQILHGDFVSIDEGTGSVHIAPGFGEDDQKLGEANGLEIVCPVDNQGKFTSEVSDYAGMHVFDANKPIVQRLKEMRVLVRHETYVHNYPHCWRTDTPLIYKALNSWYVRVTDFRDRMVELNQEINWIPEHIKDGQFGKWLENARDWSISRNRFWGTPIPIWKSDDPKYPRIDVYGSLDEIKRDFGVRPKDLHKPYIDELIRPNPDDPTGKSMMRRVDEVFDCWFESGSMPFAQIHYPFENKEWFEGHFPADFIVEYIAQTRGWFYTLMVLATAIFDRPPFKNCICHGVVLDEKGQKLSKRLRNYPNPEDVFETYGSDCLRWFLVSSPILRGQDLQIDREGKAIGEIVKNVINPIWNAYYFFTLYANSDKIRGEYRTDSKELLDRYVLSKTGELIRDVSAALDAYEIGAACLNVVQFLDALNNWYVRRSRDRFWRSGIDSDKVSAYNTLYTVLVTLCKVTSPLLPFISEEVFKGLTDEESVHLSKWPAFNDFPQEHELVAEMDLVRSVCSASLSIREANDLRIRQPLSVAIFASPNAENLEKYGDIIKDEINVKRVDFASSFEEFAEFRLEVNSRILGPRLGSKMKDVLNAAKSGKWKRLSSDKVELAGEVLTQEEFKLQLVPKEGITGMELPDSSGVVVLETHITDELFNEGLARDLVRYIQQARKEAEFHISDKITIKLNTTSGLLASVKPYLNYIAEQTLAKSIEFDGVGDEEWFSQKVKVADDEVTLFLRKCNQ